MNDAEVLDVIPVDETEPRRLEQAAQLFEQALKAGRNDPNIAYLLGIAHKKRGKLAEARAAFRSINQPDANVMLQLGLVSFAEKQYAQAEQEFARSRQLEPTSYAAGYNLLLAHLCQGKIEAALPLARELRPSATTPADRRLLELLEPLLERGEAYKGKGPPPLATAKNSLPAANDPLLNMSDEEEKRVIELLLGLGQMEAVFPLLRSLAASRPQSAAALEANATAVLARTRMLVERCDWVAAEKLLLPLVQSLTAAHAQGRPVAPTLQLAAFNLLGCVECMLQEFDSAAEYFSWAIKLAPTDPYLHQNLALSYELKGQLDQADGPWNRYFELQNQVPTPALPNYRDTLAFEGLSRLADAFSKKERWHLALAYLQKASRLRPDDSDALERLFHMYNQVKRPDDARRTLKKLRDLRPNDPQMELYELDLREVKTLEDIEHLLTDIRKTLNRFPNDLRVEEKAVMMVGNIVPIIGRMCDQYTDQLNRVMDQVRRLPNYQINWNSVHEVMRDLQREFGKLRRIANKCLSLVNGEEHRKVIRDLIEHIDRKVEVCQSMKG